MSGFGARTGWIFDIQRFSIHDGPGIRTTVFCKGCPLRCAWCHNPEAVSRRPHLSFIPSRCIGCGACLEACPHQAHLLADGQGHLLDRERCTVCGACAAECYAGALELVGREASVAEVLREVLADRVFYEQSGGGLTVSGGEPLAQVEFTEGLLAEARREGLHTALETCGQYDWSRLERVLPLVDLFLFDVKECDSALHESFTGAGNERILANLRQLHASGAAILVRLPLIPDMNARDEHFDGLAALARELPRLRGFEVMPYHRLGVGKRERMGLPGDELDIVPPDEATAAAWRSALRDRDVPLVENE